MRPSEPDIPVPPWPEGTHWIGGPVAAMEAVTSRAPALVHFFDAAQLNSLRSLEYLRLLSEQYQPLGLRVYGVHTPRWPLTEGLEDATRAIERLSLPHPVALDLNRRIWSDYGCHGWPHVFVWRKGGLLAWSQLGEGDYGSLESALREVITEATGEPEGGWPELLEPIRPSDRPGAALVAPSAEMLIGGSLETPWSADREGAAIEATYQGAAAYASIGGVGKLSVTVDGSDTREMEVAGPELVELASHGDSGAHTVVITPDQALEIYSLSFAPGLAAK